MDKIITKGGEKAVYAGFSGDEWYLKKPVSCVHCIYRETYSKWQLILQIYRTECVCSVLMQVTVFRAASLKKLFRIEITDFFYLWQASVLNGCHCRHFELIFFIIVL